VKSPDRLLQSYDAKMGELLTADTEGEDMISDW